jgi:hypothetical protein
MSEIKSVCIQTRAPGRIDPAGAIEIGYYMIVDGFVQMCDEVGKLIGKKVALNGEDPRKVAGRRARESNFDRPLRYPKIGVA